MKIRIDPLDELFSHYVRLRAIKRVGGCERCLAPKFDILKDNGDILPAYKQIQCSHYHKRRKLSVRFDESNANGFCFGCHQFFEENRDEYTLWMKFYLGQEQLGMLANRMRISYPRPDRKAIEIYLKEQIKQLEDHR